MIERKHSKRTNAYDFAEHVHRFACWTAARAVQPGARNAELGNCVLSGKNITSAINASEIRCILKKGKTRQRAIKDFDEWHKEACSNLTEELNIPKSNRERSYGIVAKIIAVYLKTAVLLTEGERGKLAKVIHPPVDSQILDEVENNYPNALNYNWTSLDEENYYEIIAAIKKRCDGDALWKIEYCWNPEKP